MSFCTGEPGLCRSVQVSLACVVLYEFGCILLSYPDLLLTIKDEPDLCRFVRIQGKWANYLDLCLHDKGEPDLCPAVQVSLICVQLYR